MGCRLAERSVLFLGWGNPSRGDDAIGPLLCDWLAGFVESAACGHCEVQQDFQLQVEDAMDLVGRDLVVFIDASVNAPAPYSLTELAPLSDGSVTTHAMSPQAVLAVTREILGATPPAFVLAVRGESFALGEGLSSAGAAHLEAARVVLEGIATVDDPIALCRALSFSDTPAPEPSSA